MNSSKIPDEKSSKYGDNITIDDLVVLEEFLRSAASSIAAVRAIMSKSVENDAPLSEAIRNLRGRTATDTALVTLSEDQADVAAALAILCNEVSPETCEDLIRQRLIDYFEIEGWVAAGVLLCMLRYPGQFITHAHLGAAAGMLSPTPGVIRVYIYQLRSRLKLRGFKGGAIETGRRSYRIVRSAAFEIINALGR